MRKAGGKRKVGMIIGIAVALVVAGVAVAVALYVDNNRHGEARMRKRMRRASWRSRLTLAGRS